MMAKVIWKAKNSDSGMPPLRVSRPTPASMARPKSPMKALPSLKARL